MLRGDPTWQTSSTGPDVDAELERGGRDESSQLSRPQTGFHPFASLPRKAAVVGRHHVGTEPLTELVGQALRQPPRVDEHECGPVVLYERGDAIEDLAHLLGGRDGTELGSGELHRQLEATAVPAVDDRRSAVRGPYRSEAKPSALSAAGWRRVPLVGVAARPEAHRGVRG